MKAASVFTIMLFLLFAGAQSGCTSTKSGTASRSEPNYGYTNILEMLRKEPNLRITGPISNPEIRVNGGGRSISGSNEPLFVIDGAVAGQGYSSVSSIDVNVVKYINVISAARSGKYGSMGAMGVIEIITK